MYDVTIEHSFVKCELVESVFVSPAMIFSVVPGYIDFLHINSTVGKVMH